jgi:hypothetical protein
LLLIDRSTATALGSGEWRGDRFYPKETCTMGELSLARAGVKNHNQEDACYYSFVSRKIPPLVSIIFHQKQEQLPETRYRFDPTGAMLNSQELSPGMYQVNYELDDYQGSDGILHYHIAVKDAEVHSGHFSKRKANRGA